MYYVALKRKKCYNAYLLQRMYIYYYKLFPITFFALLKNFPYEKSTVIPYISPQYDDIIIS